MKEWYLMTSNADQNPLGGYENDLFSEILETGIASDGVLYNCDLSVGRKIRCMIQGNTADSRLKSIERTGLFYPGTVKAGMYLFYDNRYWLITGYPGTNGIYEKAVLFLCQYKLKWQNSSGAIVERWCSGTFEGNEESGEIITDSMILSSNTYSLLLPNDSECLKLEGKRVFIDKRENAPQKVYKITRIDDILCDYGTEHGGIFKATAEKREFNPITDNQELGICGYRAPDPKPDPGARPDTNITASIDGDLSIKVGRAASYAACFTDESGNPLTNLSADWNVICDYEVNRHVEDNTIILEINDENAVGSTLILQLSNYNYEMEITIESLY
ncbi:hypothetical protein C0033_07330 [Clostridium sp. chh4-2]|uniref:hypothetical protein n=1 Tax=Clostridium sp. chh4-2 TaxID=2067550 RepID=UPI000CCEC8A7|nr:hypothetical protein [Clostridium sp. chh4-2]PNV62820.1 hypothetical protein C0033_07330 [Clostridium sp. chh4-2]